MIFARTTVAASSLIGLLTVGGCDGPPSGTDPVAGTTRSPMMAATRSDPVVAPVPPAAVPGGAPSLGGGVSPVRCPVAIAAGLAVPDGGRVMGPLPRTRAPLSYAALVSGAPGDVRDDRVLAEDEPDTTAGESGDGVARTTLTVTPGAPHSLACGYAMKPGFTEQGTLLIVPLPAGARWTCRIAPSPPGAAAAECTPAR